MKHFQWLQEKPEFTEDCIVLTKTYWEAIQAYDYNADHVKYVGYWMWLNMNGEEVGDIEDLYGDFYLTIPL